MYCGQLRDLLTGHISIKKLRNIMNGVIGIIWMFGGNFAPRNWAFCNGTLLAISQNTALFSLLGTIYGGDGRTTFALPDLQGRFPMHAGNGPALTNRRLGEKLGIEQVTLTSAQIPSHNHAVTVGVSGEMGEEDIANGGVIANSTGTFNEDAATGQTLGGLTQSNVGGTQAHTNLQPCTVVNFVICLIGVYPSRS